MGNRRFSLLLLLVSLTACGGASALPGGVSGGSSGLRSTAARDRVPVTLHLVIGHPHRHHRRGRLPQSVSPSTDGVEVDAYPHGAAQTPANLVTSTKVDVSSGSPACGGHKGFPRTCIAAITLRPSSAYDFVIDTYNTPPSTIHGFGGASLVGTGTLTNAIVQLGKANAFTAYISGVIYGLSGLPPSMSLPGDGAPHSIALVIDPQDFGNAPLTAGSKDPFANPIAVTFQETNDTGHASLSLNGGPPSSKVTVSKSSDSVELTYDGNGKIFYGITVTLTSAAVGGYGGATESMNVSPLILTASGCCHYQVYPYLTMGGNGDVASVYLTELHPTSTSYTATPSNCAAIADATTIKPGLFGLPYFVVFARPVQSDNSCTIAVSDGTSTVDVQVLNDYNGFLGTPTVSRLGEPTSGSGVSGITVGADGNMWFGESGTLGGNIGESQPTGSSPTMSDYALPTTHGIIDPSAIAPGPDGNLWVGNSYISSGIGSVTTGGSGTEYANTSGTFPMGVAMGADGAMWFVEYGTANAIGRITTNGSIMTSGPVNSGSIHLTGITLGPDGNMWFTENGAGIVGKITPSMSVTQFVLPVGSQPNGITAGPDGALWFADQGKRAIGRIPVTATVANPQVTEYTGMNGSDPFNITTGPDAALWFTESNDAISGPYNGTSVVGRIDPYSHAITEYTLSFASLQPFGIASGPDGAIWVTEYAGDSVDRIAIQTSSAARRRDDLKELFTRIDRLHSASVPRMPL